MSNLLDGAGEWETPSEGDTVGRAPLSFGTSDSSSLEGNILCSKNTQGGEGGRKLISRLGGLSGSSSGDSSEWPELEPRWTDEFARRDSPGPDLEVGDSQRANFLASSET